MRVIAVHSQKGGTGKTTISGHLAVAANAAGAGPVALIDTDPQGSLSLWHAERPRDAEGLPVDQLFLVASTIAALAENLRLLREAGIKLVLIDTPPSMGESVQQVIEQADLVLIPTRPSPHDLRAVGPTIDLVEKAGKPLVFVLNAAKGRARITAEAAMALSQSGTIAATILGDRVDYAASMTDGRTVMELDTKGASAAEIQKLWAYVAKKIKKVK